MACPEMGEMYRAMSFKHQCDLRAFYTEHDHGGRYARAVQAQAEIAEASVAAHKEAVVHTNAQSSTYENSRGVVRASHALRLTHGHLNSPYQIQVRPPNRAN